MFAQPKKISKVLSFHKALTLVFFSTFILLFSCDKNEQENGADEYELEEYKVSGSIKNYKGLIYLKKVDNENLIVVDSAETDAEGNYELEVMSAEPDFFVLGTSDSLSHLIILDNKNVKVNADAKDFIESIRFTGSDATQHYVKFNSKINKLIAQQNHIKKEIPRLIQRNDLDSLKLIEVQLKNVQEVTAQFIKQYIDTIVPSLAVFNIIGYLNIEKDFDYLQSLSKKMEEKLPHSKYTKMLSKEIANILAMQKKLEENGIALGAVAPEITLPNPDGKMVSLSSLRGKYILLDFWASWCGPCRAENPNVVKVYHKFKNKGFDVFSVSLDKEKNAWLSAIQKDGLAWNHVSDLKFWESSVVPLYGIEGIPATFLLDKEGKVIAKNLRGKDLENKLQEVIPN